MMMRRRQRKMKQPKHLVAIIIYYILCVDISVIKPWIKMIPVKWYDIISLHRFELSNQIDCNNLVGPIVLRVLYIFRFRLTPGVKLAGRIALQFCQRFLVLQLGGLIFFNRVICSKQIINLLLTEREGRTGEYWPEVVAVRTERSEVRTKTTEGQYSTLLSNFTS